MDRTQVLCALAYANIREALTTWMTRCSRLAMAACCLLLGACAVIHIDGTEGVRTDRHVGIVNVQIVPRGNDVTVVSTTGAGVVISGHSGVLGWVKERSVLLPQPAGCQIVLIEATPQQADEVVEVLKRSNTDLSAVCVLTDRRKK